LTFPGNPKDLKEFLDAKVDKYNRPDFIELDPVSIPHLFSKKEDIEIMGFFASVLAWGQRPTIIGNCRKLIQYFENEPHKFILEASQKDLIRLKNF
jgi:hypothetical protein